MKEKNDNTKSTKSEVQSLNTVSQKCGCSERSAVPVDGRRRGGAERRGALGTKEAVEELQLSVGGSSQGQPAHGPTSELQPGSEL